MIRIDLYEARMAYSEGKIKLKDLSYLHDIDGKKTLTEKQFLYLLYLERDSQPHEIVKDK